jgi:hypothetical protein
MTYGGMDIYLRAFLTSALYKSGQIHALPDLLAG